MAFVRLSPTVSARYGSGVTAAWRATSDKRYNALVLAFGRVKAAELDFKRGVRLEVEFDAETGVLRFRQAATGYAIVFKRENGADACCHIVVELPGIHGEKRRAAEVPMERQAGQDGIWLAVTLPAWAKRGPAQISRVA
jgi:hypothetical protein